LSSSLRGLELKRVIMIECGLWKCVCVVLRCERIRRKIVEKEKEKKKKEEEEESEERMAEKERKRKMNKLVPSPSKTTVLISKNIKVIPSASSIFHFKSFHNITEKAKRTTTPHVVFGSTSFLAYVYHIA
jgi:hypothetical protein